MAIIPLCSAVATALRTCTILVPALATEVALLSQLYRFGVLFGKLEDIRVTLSMIFGQPTQYDIGDLYWNAPVPALWRRWLLSEVRVPHLFYTFVCERGMAGKQFIAANGEGILIGGWDGVSFPLFRGHVDRCAANGLTGTGGSGGQFGDTKVS